MAGTLNRLREFVPATIKLPQSWQRLNKFYESVFEIF